MRKTIKEMYVSPEAEALEIRTQCGILTISGEDPESITWEDDLVIS